MNERKYFEKYQDFLNKRKLNQAKQNNNINILSSESKTEPSNIIKKQQKNVIQSCIESIKEQMKDKNKYKDKRQNISSSNINNKTKKQIENYKTKSKIVNKMNSTNNNYYNRIKNDVQKNIGLYSGKLLYSDMENNKTFNKIRKNYSNNHFSQNNLRYNFSSDFSPYKNKEISHIISSYDFKNKHINENSFQKFIIIS